MLNFNDADVEQVDNAVSYPGPNIDDDKTKTFDDDISNVEGFKYAVFYCPPNLDDDQMDLAGGVGVRCPVVGDHRPIVRNRCPAFDLYAFGEQGNYSDTTVPLLDGWMEMLRASNYPDHHVHGVLAEEHGYYSAETDVDPNYY